MGDPAQRGKGNGRLAVYDGEGAHETGAPLPFIISLAVYYTVTDAYCEPHPEPPPPILVGGEGERYLLRAVAEHADFWLPSSRKLDVLRHKLTVLRQHCADVGRDPAQIRVALTLPIFLTATQADAESWTGAALRSENPPFAGTPAALIDYLGQYIDAGVSLFHRTLHRGLPVATGSCYSQECGSLYRNE